MLPTAKSTGGCHSRNCCRAASVTVIVNLKVYSVQTTPTAAAVVAEAAAAV